MDRDKWVTKWIINSGMLDYLNDAFTLQFIPGPRPNPALLAPAVQIA